MLLLLLLDKRHETLERLAEAHHQAVVLDLFHGARVHPVSAHVHCEARHEGAGPRHERSLAAHHHRSVVHDRHDSPQDPQALRVILAEVQLEQPLAVLLEVGKVPLQHHRAVLLLSVFIVVVFIVVVVVVCFSIFSSTGAVLQDEQQRGKLRLLILYLLLLLEPFVRIRKRALLILLLLALRQGRKHLLRGLAVHRVLEDLPDRHVGAALLSVNIVVVQHRRIRQRLRQFLQRGVHAQKPGISSSLR